MHYDVIIVGAGSMGSAAGYYLAKSGKKTLLLDSFNPPHARGSHHGDTRIIRYAYGEGAEYIPFVLQAQKLWDELAEESGQSLFLQTGVLNVGRKDSAFINNVMTSAKTYSLPLEILNANEVHERWDGISLPADFIGCFEGTSGVLKSEECIRAYSQLAQKHGATIVTEQKVSKIAIHADGVTVKTGNDTYHADSLIITAGAWAKELLAMTGIHLPLNPVRKTFAWFNVREESYDEQVFPAFAFETDFGFYYGFPSIERAGLKVGRHDGGESIDPNETIPAFGEKQADKVELERFLDQFMPSSERQLNYGKTCIYTMTPDEDFIIDLHPTYSHVAFAAGFSGHGFKFSSVVGQALSELIMFGKSEQHLSPFSVKRFC